MKPAGYPLPHWSLLVTFVGNDKGQWAKAKLGTKFITKFHPKDEACRLRQGGKGASMFISNFV
jgi:hypothetical protein